MNIDSSSSSSSIHEKMKAKLVEMTKNCIKIGKDDPRRITHSIKVAIALTLNSFLYYNDPLYNSFGQSGIWAVITVVFVFEFTVGATLYKSLNRGFATLLGGAMGVGVKYLADQSGEKAEPIVIGSLVFILGAIFTFLRFFPSIKKKCDYGAVIFILTFSMVAVSGYRTDEIVRFAYQRLSTVVIGGVTCILISILVYPAWAGEDLHNLIAKNVEKLGSSLQGFGSAYYGNGEGVANQDHKSSLNSKSSEESLANFAWWEIGHGEFRFRHPWKQYLTIGGLARECASHIEALCGYLNNNHSGTQSDFKKEIEEPCTRMCLECSNAIREISLAMKTKAHPSSMAIQTHLKKSREAIDDLKTLLENSSSSFSMDRFFEIIPCVAVTSILIDIINCVDKISNSVDQLFEKTHFETSSSQLSQQQLHCRGIVKPFSEDEFVTIEIDNDLSERNHLQTLKQEQKSQELISGAIVV